MRITLSQKHRMQWPLFIQLRVILNADTSFSHSLVSFHSYIHSFIYSLTRSLTHSLVSLMFLSFACLLYIDDDSLHFNLWNWFYNIGVCALRCDGAIDCEAKNIQCYALRGDPSFCTHSKQPASPSPSPQPIDKERERERTRAKRVHEIFYFSAAYPIFPG